MADCDNEKALQPLIGGGGDLTTLLNTLELILSSIHVDI